MKVKIKAKEDFQKYLETSYPDISIENSETVVDGTFNAFFSMKPGDVLISILITYSPMMFNAIKEYVHSTKQKVIVTTEEDQYVITPQTFDNVFPTFQKEAIILSNEEKNGKNW